MVWVDYVIIGIVGFSALVSLIRGFVREALSLVTWGGGVLYRQPLLCLSRGLFHAVY
ncbi:hypothetical protein OS21_11010 [Dickeya oryzae]